MSTYLSRDEAAKALSLSWDQLIRITDACGGPLPSFETNGERLYLRADVEAYKSGTLPSGQTLPLNSEQWLQPVVGECFSESVTEIGSSLIRNVLLCGNASRNGYSIPPSAFGSESNARTLYAAKPVFLDHGGSGKELSRSVKDMAAVVVNVRMRSGKPYGDLDTEGYPQGPALLQLAKSKPRDVGLSHTASYTMAKDRKSVLSVEAVHSVDVVFRPATTTTFFEQGNRQSQEVPEERPLFVNSGYGYVSGADL